MTTIYQKVKPLVVFIWDGARVSNHDVLKPSPPGALGAGFFVTFDAVAKDGRKVVKICIVTARHVPNGCKTVLIRFNRSDAPIAMRLNFAGAIDLGDAVDLVLIPVPDENVPDIRGLNRSLTPSMICKTLEQQKEWEIEEGTRVFALGVLTGINAGFNIPAYRFGRISMLGLGKVQMKDWKVPQDADWLDMAGGQGMSGSPVFLDTQSSDKSIRLVGVFKDVYDTNEGSFVRPQNIILTEPSRNLALLLQKYYSQLAHQGYEIAH